MESINEGPAPSIKIIAYNCWGIKWISKHRHARFMEIGKSLAAANPDIVGLQECFAQADFDAIRENTSQILPYAKRYFSGAFGCGLAILSRWPIEESSMIQFPLNGRPTAFYRGDWYVGKGIAHARIRIGPEPRDVAEVFCTHLHAPYEAEPNDSYLCHRTAQAWEIAKVMRYAVERGHLTIGMGDFNMRPLSLAHRIVETHSRTRDVWRIHHPNSSLGSTTDKNERARNVPLPDANYNIVENGTTCDSLLNTWRWNKTERKRLERGHDIQKLPTDIDPKAKRLDYIFIGNCESGKWQLVSTCVGMMERHPILRCSLSDHFSVEAILTRDTSNDRRSIEHGTEQNLQIRTLPSSLPESVFVEIQDLTETYFHRETRQRMLRLGHGTAQLFITIGCLIAIWWSPSNYVSFLLLLISTLGLGAGLIDALIGGLFVGGELRLLEEFRWEIGTARKLAQKAAYREAHEAELKKSDMNASETMRESQQTQSRKLSNPQNSKPIPGRELAN